MTAEFAHTDEVDEAQEVTKPPEAKKAKPSSPAPAPERLSPTMRDIRDEEEKSLRDWLEEIGTQGAFKVQLRREKPKTFRDRATGKEHTTEGYLETYDHTIDEPFIQQEHGGGTYALKITRKGADGSYKYVKGLHRTIVIAGDPNIERLPTNAPPPTAVGPASPMAVESAGMVREAFGVLKDSFRDMADRADRADRKPAPTGIDPAVKLMFDQLQQELKSRTEEMRELRRELSEAKKPAEDPIKDKILGSLIDGESGRIAALRQAFESEMRQVKELAAATLAQERQHHQSERERLHDRHDREIQSLRQSHEREVAMLNATHGTTSAVATQSANLQGKLLENDIKRLERDNERLSREVAELRARKDKSIIETVKDLNAVKDALGEGGDKTSFDKVVEIISNPAAAEFVKGIFDKGPQPAQAAAQVVPAAPAKPVVLRSKDGQTFVQHQGRLLPVKKKPKVIPAQANADGTITPEIVLPQIDEVRVKELVGYLERAFAGNQDPEVLAQSARPMVPDEILGWIREHHTEQSSGVDLFMGKVAKLPGSSPLSTQSGRNWLRKVGKALIGD